MHLVAGHISSVFVGRPFWPVANLRLVDVLLSHDTPAQGRKAPERRPNIVEAHGRP